MADVFLSYKSERRRAVEHVAGILRAYGYSVWYDAGLNTGQDFSAQIERELRDAKAVVTLWCKLSVNSEWVKEEAHLAKQLGTAIPVLMEPVSIPFGFGLSDTVDLGKWDGSPRAEILTRLLLQIGAKVGRPPQGDVTAIQAFEEPWRRYGAPTLAQFALDTKAAEVAEKRRQLSLRALAQRFANGPQPSRSTDPSRKPASKAPLLAGGALAALLAVAAGGYVLFSTPEKPPQPAPQPVAPPPKQETPAPAAATATPPAPVPVARSIRFLLAPDDTSAGSLARSNPVVAQFGRDLARQFEQNSLNAGLAAEVAPELFGKDRTRIDFGTMPETFGANGQSYHMMVLYRVGVELQNLPAAPSLVRPAMKVSAQIISLKTGRAIAQIEPRIGQLAPVPATCNSACIAEALATDMRVASAEIVRFALERMP